MYLLNGHGTDSHTLEKNDATTAEIAFVALRKQPGSRTDVIAPRNRGAESPRCANLDIASRLSLSICSSPEAAWTCSPAYWSYGDDGWLVLWRSDTHR